MGQGQGKSEYMQIVTESRAKATEKLNSQRRRQLKEHSNTLANTHSQTHTHTGTYIYRQAAEFSEESLPQPASISLAAAATAAALPPLLSISTRVFLAFSFASLRVCFLSCFPFALCRVCVYVCVFSVYVCSVCGYVCVRLFSWHTWNENSLFTRSPSTVPPFRFRFRFQLGPSPT